MRNGFASVSFESLIVAALMGQLYHHRRFWDAASRYTRKITARRAANIAVDLQEEVVGEAIAQLLRIGAAGLEHRSGLELFRLAVLRAIRKVRADNAAPGERTRYSADEGMPKVAADDADRVVQVDADIPTAVDLAAVPDPGGERPIAEFEVRTDVERILRLAPPSVATALRLIHIEDWSARSVAAMQGIDRTTLYRRIDNFCAPWRLAA